MISFAAFQNPLSSVIVSYLRYAVVLIQRSSVFLLLLRSCCCFIDLFHISGDVSQQYILSKGERKSWSE